MRTDPLCVSVARDDCTGARCSNERPASPRTTMLSGFQDEAAIVAVRKLSVNAHRAQLVSEHAAHHGDHAALRSEINKDVARGPRLAPFEAHRLRLIRRRRNTHRSIVPSGRALVPAWSTIRPALIPTASRGQRPMRWCRRALTRSSRGPSERVSSFPRIRRRSSTVPRRPRTRRRARGQKSQRAVPRNRPMLPRPEPA